MNEWTRLTEAEGDEVWRRVRRELHFKPSVKKEDWPGFEPPAPFVAWAIPAPWTNEATEELFECAVAAFKRALPPGQRMYALDWQHPSYWFSPHADAQWLVPVLPNGDYYLFLAPELAWGWLGHPWEQTITVFGQPLLDAVLANRPAMFRTIRRRAP